MALRRLRLQRASCIGRHRVQLVYGDGAVPAFAHGARIVSEPTDYPYGERQYTAEDPGGHNWTFSESISDADPASRGGASITPGT